MPDDQPLAFEAGLQQLEAIVKEMESGELPLERALSQLAAWVLECERRGESYTLLLPGKTLPAAHGLAQRRACLEALAVYEA